MHTMHQLLLIKEPQHILRKHSHTLSGQTRITYKTHKSCKYICLCFVLIFWERHFYANLRRSTLILNVFFGADFFKAKNAPAIIFTFFAYLFLGRGALQHFPFLSTFYSSKNG